MSILRLPLTFEEQTVGVAEISEDGGSITMQLMDAGSLPNDIREAVTRGLVESLSIGMNYTEGNPLNGLPVVINGKPRRSLSPSEKLERWNRRNHSWGM